MGADLWCARVIAKNNARFARGKNFRSDRPAGHNRNADAIYDKLKNWPTLHRLISKDLNRKPFVPKPVKNSNG
jgi:hypothetical protein